MSFRIGFHGRGFFLSACWPLVLISSKWPEIMFRMQHHHNLITSLSEATALRDRKRKKKGCSYIQTFRKTQPDCCHPWQHEPEAMDNGVATWFLRPLWMVLWVQKNKSIKLTDGDHPQLMLLQTGFTPISWKDIFLIQVALAKDFRLASWDSCA